MDCVFKYNYISVERENSEENKSFMKEVMIELGIKNFR